VYEVNTGGTPLAGQRSHLRLLRLHIQFALAMVLASPAAARGQAAITGAVVDALGAPVGGVVVEASSPALIERVRSAATDDAGRYRIEDLRPGIYAVQFTLAGWKPAERTGIELLSGFTATIDAKLVLATLSEQVIVMAASSPVDVHNAARAMTLSGETIAALPTVRSYNALVGLIPGVVTNVNDVVTGTAATSFPIHGGRTNESRLLLDGLTVGSPPSGNSATSYVFDVGTAQEVTFAAAGGLGETETAGLVMNILPKSGGNTLSGSLLGAGTGKNLQSDNLTEDLRRAGVAAATPLAKVYDISGTVGGPIRVDRAWFFGAGHVGGSTRESANVYYNHNAGNPAAWLYAPDSSQREYSDRTFENASARLTWQIARRHQIVGYWDAQAMCRTCTGATAGLAEPSQISPEAVGVLGRSLHVSQARWSSPVTDRLLLEAGYGGTFFGVGNFEREPNPTRDLIRVAEQCASGCAANGNIPGLVYRSQDFSKAHTGSYLWNAALTYVTGSHALKVGYQHTFMTDDRTWFTNTQNLAYRVNNGVPNQLTQSISPWVNDVRVAWQGLYAQEQWTHDRLTLEGAARLDRARSWYPEQQEGPSRFLPSPIRIPATSGVDNYKDITLRTGAAYDVRGDGNTALKVTLGKYLEGAGAAGTYANANPTLRLPRTTSAFGTAGVTRSWTDANQNFIPDCDLLDPGAQDQRPAGGDLCGALSNADFGRNVLTDTYDPAILDGWRVRPSDWTLNASLEQRLTPRAALSVTYTRRSFDGFTVADNKSLAPPDLTPFTITAPMDERLPGGGGYPVTGLYDVVPEKAGQISNLITAAADYGKWSQYFSGVDVTINARFGRSLTVAGGTSTGQTVADNCQVRERLPELATTATGTSAFGAGLSTSAVTPLSPYCHVASGILTQFRGFASYMIAKVDMQLSAVVMSKPGAMLAANYTASNAEVAPSLGRNLSGNAANVTINLIEPGTLYGDRINELDVRVGKIVRLGTARAGLAVDIYNALNSSAILTYNPAFVPGAAWLRPLTILTPRLFRITANVDF
jgi:hypothetical protein